MKDFPVFRVVMIFSMVAIVSALVIAAKEDTAKDSFYFVQLSDTHWGFNDPKINPDYAGTLKKAIAIINTMKPLPDFAVFTGDDTHTTEDPKERRARLKGFLDIVKTLNVKNIKYLPGEHDAGLDKGQAYRELVGISNYAFDYNNVHFVAVDNVSQPQPAIGDDGLKWLANDLKKQASGQKIIIFTHRPFFDLYPDWDWHTTDGSKAIELLKPFNDVTVFYGHIHQVNQHMEGNIEFDSANGMMYPLPAPGSVPKKAPIPWNPDKPYAGLGFRAVAVEEGTPHAVITEYPVIIKEKEIEVSAKKAGFLPAEINLIKGVPVVLKLKSLDVKHGFYCRGLGIREDINPDKITEVHFIPEKAGVYNFSCDVFCGPGHDDMNGRIIVVE
jgi:predicted MPP superfamily phosphohydrolase